MKLIDSSYKLIEFFSGKVVSAVTVEFKFGTVVLIEKYLFHSIERLHCGGSRISFNSPKDMASCHTLGCDQLAYSLSILQLR